MIVTLCDRAMLLDSGEKLAMGSPKTIVGKYQKLIYAPQHKRHAIREEICASGSGGWQDASATLASRATVLPPENTHIPENDPEAFFDPNLKPLSTLKYESHGAYIESPEILTKSGEKVNCLKRGESYRYAYKVRFEQGATNVRFGMLIKTTTGLELGGAASAPCAGQGIPYLAPETTVRIEFWFTCNLNPGSYFLNAGVTGSHREEETYLHRVLDFCMFKVMPVSDNISTAIVDFNCAAEFELMNNPLQKNGECNESN
jgi:lipopolysaccharide transport system ATP-binding protein